MSQFWSDLVHRLKPYTPGEQPQINNLIKLNTNENPFPPSPAVIAAINNLDKDTLRLYPDPNAVELKDTLADIYGLTRQHIFVGNGSDEVLAFAFCTFFKNSKPILYPDITYSFYPVYCSFWEIDYRNIPLNDGFELLVEDYMVDNGGIIFANPNAPTGRAISLDKVKSLLDFNTETVVIVDEAYVDFGAQSAIELVDQYPNLLVIHTFSKSRNLAGLRVGYALGNPQLIEGLERVKNSFNSYPLDRLAIPAAVAALKDQTFFEQTCKVIRTTRTFLTLELNKLNFHVVPSKANFVFASHTQIPADTLFNELRKKRILVRYFNLPRINNHLRITVGTRKDMEMLISVLREILG
ncbi:MAG: histidinol-phosphate transaminase [Desulfobacteraceae bacterium]|jgi:histidinol-phosphate aminotransferase